VVGLNAQQVGEAAFRAGLALYELTPVKASLEQAYLELTQDEVEYRSEVAA
jgi:ABC-2 type transport system ATP-binding protein